MELRTILDIVLKRRWIVFPVFFIAIFSTVLGTLMIKTWYDTTAKIFIQKSPAASSLLVSIGLQSQSLNTSLSDTDRSDYVELVKMRPVIERALTKHPVKRQRISAKLIHAVPFLKSFLTLIGVTVPSEEQDMTAEKLLQWSLTRYFFPRPYVKIEQHEDTDIIKINAVSVSPEESMKLSNAIAESFIEEELSRIRRDYQNAKESVETTIGASRGEYIQSLKQLREFKEIEKTVDITAETSAIITKLYDYKKSMEDNYLALYKTKAMISQAQSKLKNNPKYIMLTEGLQYNELIRDLKFSLKDLYISLAETKTKYTPNHPNVVDIENKIQKTKEMIQSEMTKIFGSETKGVDPVYQEVETKLAGYYADLAGYDSQKETYPKVIQIFERELLGLPKKTFEYSQLQLQVEVTDEVYRALLKCKYQISLAETAALSNIYVVEYAVAPADDSKHKHPSLLFNFAVALFFGGFLGIGMGLFFEYFDDSMTEKDLNRFKGLHLLGKIFRKGREDGYPMADSSPNSPLREAFRAVRNRVFSAVAGKNVRRIVIASSVAGEGTSFVSKHIAISMALTEKKIVLIDGNMRRPRLHLDFGLDNTRGLSSYLMADSDLDNVLLETSVRGLRVMPAGPVPQDPASLVESKKMRELIVSVLETCDMVVIDSPPILVANDAVVFSGLVDGLIWVLADGKVGKKDFEECHSQLQNANSNIVGVILNNVEMFGSRRHRYD